MSSKIAKRKTKEELLAMAKSGEHAMANVNNIKSEYHASCDSECTRTMEALQENARKYYSAKRGKQQDARGTLL